VKSGDSAGGAGARRRAGIAERPGQTHDDARNTAAPIQSGHSLIIDKKSLAGRSSSCFSVNGHNEEGQGAARRKAMERDTALKRACNDGLSRLAGFAIGCGVGSEPSWAALAVSRATVRSALVNFAAALNDRPNEFNMAISERSRRPPPPRPPVPAGGWRRIASPQTRIPNH